MSLFDLPPKETLAAWLENPERLRMLSEVIRAAGFACSEVFLASDGGIAHFIPEWPRARNIEVHCRDEQGKFVVAGEPDGRMHVMYSMPRIWQEDAETAADRLNLERHLRWLCSAEGPASIRPPAEYEAEMCEGYR